MERRTTSIRPASWERAGKEMHVEQKDGGFVPFSATVARTPLALDGDADLSAILIEAAFDTIGAARWIKDQNQTFARAALASAITELQTVAARLGVKQ